jgi:CHAT domain-containing protein
MESGDAATALSISERSRARLTLDAVQDALARADANAKGTLIQREQSLQNAAERAGANLTTVLEQLAAVENEIRVAYPRLAAVRDREPLTASEMQAQLLDANTAIVEYSLANDRSFAWVLTHDAIRGVELPKRADIEPIAVRLHAALAEGDQRVRQHTIRKLIGELSDVIIRPLRLPRASRLIVVPDGALFYVPFAALQNRSTALIDEYEVTIAPSASSVAVMTEAARGRSHERVLAVFADPVFAASDPRIGGRSAAIPDADLVRSVKDAGLELKRLPSTRAEAETITQLIAGRSRKVLDFAASRKTVLREDLGRYRFVHFATHALVNAQHPHLSGIVLSLVDEKGTPVDGFVRVHDIFALDAAADLVVLSACRTAMGKELRGEGIVGLVSAFFAAGAPRVVASYWDVKDRATAELMKRFYRGMLRDGLAPAAALRAAQRSMRREERYASPYYWASFALHGVR